MISAAVQSKADQLFDQGAVHTVPGAFVCAVKGEHDTYLVTLCPDSLFGTDEWIVVHCTCRATDECSHIAAAKQVAEWEGSP